MTTGQGDLARKDEHPALAESRERLQALEHRSPPGYPLHYTMQHVTIVCNGCRLVTRYSALYTTRRGGASGKTMSLSGPGEKIYDLPVHSRRDSLATPRCDSCIDLPKEPVPLLPPREKNLKPLWAQKADPSRPIEIDLKALGLI